MKGTLQEWMVAGESLMEQAMTALRFYHEAQAAGLPPEEIERLRLAAESLFREANDFMSTAFGNPSQTTH